MTAGSNGIACKGKKPNNAMVAIGQLEREQAEEKERDPALRETEGDLKRGRHEVGGGQRMGTSRGETATK